MMNILLRNAHIVDPQRGIDTVSDIHIVDGTIQQIGRMSSARGAGVYDLAEKVVAPGFIDMHVHLREPGFEYKETIETGCRAAAAGGFTAVCCMPNTDPPIDDASVVRNILERARSVEGGIVQVYPIGAVTKGREGKELAPMMELADAGVVAFTDDGAPIEQAEIMRRALEYASMIGKPIIQHAEDSTMTKGGVMNEGITSTLLGMPGMPPVAEEIMVARDIRIVEYVGAAYHVAHISTRGTIELVRSAKNRKLPVTCEVTPHHFTLTDEAVGSFDTNAKMNPPLRTRDDVEAIKEGLRDGTIDVIATDHAPHSFDDKEVEFAAAPFGIVGLETAIGLAITELVETRKLTLVQLIEKFSVNPRRIVGLSPVKVLEGEKANLTIFDPKKEWIVDTRQFKSKSRNSPFHGRRLKGKSFAIINNNQFLLAD